VAPQEHLRQSSEPLLFHCSQVRTHSFCLGCGVGGSRPLSVALVAALRSPQFRSYRQQDSQELLRCLLDGVRMEEIARLSPPKTTDFGQGEGKQAKEAKGRAKQGHSAKQAKNVEEPVAHHPPPPTFIDFIFGGILESTITCHSCHFVHLHPRSPLFGFFFLEVLFGFCLHLEWKPGEQNEGTLFGLISASSRSILP